MIPRIPFNPSGSLAAASRHQRLSADELWGNIEACARVAEGLDNAVIGVLCRDGVNYAAALCGLLTRPVTIVPLPSAAKSAELAGIAAHYGCKRFLADMPEAIAALRAAGVDDGAVVRFEQLISRKNDRADADPRVLEWRGELIHFTSGSSGTPKGVRRSAANLVFEAEDVARALVLTRRDVILCTSPLTHSFSCGFLRAAVLTGAKLVAAEALDLDHVCRIAAEVGPTVFTGVPYAFQALVRHAAPAAAAFRTVRVGVTGGVALSPALADDVQRLFGFPLFEEYGLSEGGIVAINDRSDKIGTVGRPLPNVRVRVLDDQQRELPCGREGELCVIRHAAPQAYFNDAEGSRAAFADGMIRTGDLACVDEDGYISIRGRRKLMINVGGNKLDPVELENVLQELPEVHDACIVGVPDPVTSERPVAVIVCAETLSDDRIRDHCRQRVAAYKVPKSIVRVRTLPRNGVGKLHRVTISQQIKANHA